MKISILTIFPDFFPPALDEGMIRAAREKGRLEVRVVGLRDFTDDTHRTTDDYPFGGGAGMIMKVEPVVPNAEYEPFAMLQKGMTLEEQRAPETAEMWKRYAAVFAAALSRINLTLIEK